jgi:glycosyl transferase family 25
MMKAFIITLSKIPSSLESALKMITPLTHYGLDPELFVGTCGNDAEINFLKTSRILDPFENLSHNSKTVSPGVKGCFDSHFRLWQKCIELQEEIAIFEDDVVFYRTYTPIEYKDILVLSINYDWSITVPYRKYLEEDFPVDTQVVYNERYMPGASGYIIKPHAAKKLVARYSTTYLPADCAINTSICDIKLHPQLIGRSKTMQEKTSMTRSKHWYDSIQGTS